MITSFSSENPLFLLSTHFIFISPCRMGSENENNETITLLKLRREKDKISIFDNMGIFFLKLNMYMIKNGNYMVRLFK